MRSFPRVSYWRDRRFQIRIFLFLGCSKKGLRCPSRLTARPNTKPCISLFTLLKSIGILCCLIFMVDLFKLRIILQTRMKFRHKSSEVYFGRKVLTISLFYCLILLVFLILFVSSYVMLLWSLCCLFNVKTDYDPWSNTYTSTRLQHFYPTSHHTLVLRN